MFAAVAIVPSLFAQTNHYWAQQYGAQATLMGGALVGGVRDNSAIYYNPGAFTFITYPDLSVNANLYKVEKIFIEDGAGDGINLNSTQISIFPQIISGMINFKKVTRFQFAYCVMTRNHENVMMNMRYTNNDFSLTDPDIDAFIGVFDYVNQITEQWFGLGVGFKVNDKLGIGLTSFGIYRTHTNKLSNIFREIYKVDSAFSISTYNDAEQIKYHLVESLFKFGIAYETGRWKLGLTVGTPSFRIYGRGDIERELAFYSLSGSTIDTNQGFIVSDKATSTKAYFHHPWTIGAGFEYTAPKTRIAFSAEYFFRIKSYAIMNPPTDPFIYPPNYADSSFIHDAGADMLRLNNKAGQVLNVGIGIEQQLWKSFSMLAGFHTDFSSKTFSSSDQNYIHSSGSWDLYHFSAGLSYKMKKQIITLGVTYAFSPTVEVDPFASINPISGFVGKAKVFPQSLAFIVGYTYLFPRE